MATTTATTDEGASLQHAHLTWPGVPAPVSNFVGREAALGELRRTVLANRLVTLTGPGGAGKTRLAFEVATSVTDELPDGCHVIELAGLRGRDSVGGEVARALGLRAEPDRPITETLADQLADVRGLLVVDNCEHVVADARETLHSLLTRCPDLRVLATSRESLGVTGEVTWPVGPLDSEAATTLFVDRARAVQPGFTPGSADLGHIEEVVDRLDGLPLAIELAAVRVRMMEPEAIAAGLHDRFRLLTGGNKAADPRQRTLEASVAWSHELLDDQERRLARRLSVLSGFTIEAAEAVAADEDLATGDVLDTLTRLVEKSVVQIDRERPAGGYRLLESVREFLAARIEEADEGQATRDRHLDHFLELAERIGSSVALRDGAAQLDVLEADRDNLEQALRHADTTGRREDALRLAAALALFWELRGHFTWAGRWFNRLLDDGEAEPSLYRGRACWGAAHVGFYGGDIETMTQRAPEALSLGERFDDDWTVARALNIIGFATAVTTPDHAVPGLERSIALGQAAGDEWVVLNSRKMITAAAWSSQDEEAAAEPLQQLRAEAEASDAAYFLAWFHGVTGSFHTYRGDLALARQELGTAIQLADRVGEPVTGGISRAWLLRVDVMGGDHERARREIEAQLHRATASGSGLAVPDLLASLGLIAIADDAPTRAVELIAGFFEAHRATGIPFLVSIPGLVLASAHRRVGDLAAAETVLTQVAELAEGSGNAWVRACVDRERARCCLDRGELDEGTRLAHAALGVFRPLRRKPDLIETLEVLATAAIEAGDATTAARCAGAAASGRDLVGLPAPGPTAVRLEQLRDRLRREAGDVADEHFEEGTRLTLEEAASWVSRARGQRGRPDHGWDSLTPTEREVVDHLADGLTNPQIAERMFIARGTVKVHVSHVLAKLGLSNRTEVALEAVRRRDG